jgi:hypothetical protein
MLEAFEGGDVLSSRPQTLCLALLIPNRGRSRLGMPQPCDPRRT